MNRPSPRPAGRHVVLGALLGLLALVLSACGGASGAGGGTQKIVIAEPGHSLGYLPLYVGIDRGYFADEGLDVEALTLQGGSAHTNAVLTGKAWAFIGGPEHNAFAAARDKGVVIKAVSNVVNKGNVYLAARKGLKYDGDLGGFLRGKTIVTGAAGSTPHSITMYLLSQAKLKSGKDVKVVEAADPSAPLAIVKQGKADVAVTTEPVLGQGITQGIWDEPFYNVPRELGPYAYSTINVRKDSYTNDPKTVRAFIRGLQKALALIKKDEKAALAVAKKEFPTLDDTVLKETIDRSISDGLWEWKGTVTPEALATTLKVVRASGILKDGSDPVEFDDIVDMSFLEEVAGQ